MIKGILLGFLCFILFLVLHILIFHYFRIRRHFVTLRTIFFLLIPVYVLLFFALPEGFLSILTLRPEKVTPLNIFLSLAFNFCLGLWLYIFLWFGYCQFYFIVDRSISVRFMIEIEDSPNKALSLDELKKIYTPDYIYSHRLDQMVETRYLIFKNGKYFNTEKGKILSIIFKSLKKILRIWPGG